MVCVSTGEQGTSLPIPASDSHVHPTQVAMIGQNITLDSSADVRSWCVGDVIKVGTNGARVLITSIRKPCPKNDRIHGDGINKLMMHEALGGVFARVTHTGTIQCGDDITLISRPHPEWTVADVHIALYGRKPTRDIELLQQIAALPELEKPRYRDVAASRAAEAAAAVGKRSQSSESACQLRYSRLIAALLVVIAMWLVGTWGGTPNDGAAYFA
jgi:MOSC domain-containing protein YiiM